MPNINSETGIPFGTIYLHHLNTFVQDELFYGSEAINTSWEEAKVEIDMQLDWEIKNGLLDSYDRDREYERRCDLIQIEEPNIEGVYDGITYLISWLGGAPLLWVLHSPLTGTYAPCSPCVPGAGDLDSPDSEGVECYDIPMDWRDVE